MVKRYTEKNRFGKATIGIEIDTVHEIFIYETDADHFLIELKEKGIFRDKMLYSSISSNNILFDTAAVAIDRAYEYFQKQGRYEISSPAWAKLKNQAIEHLSIHSQTQPYLQRTDISESDVHLLDASNLLDRKDYDAAILALNPLFQKDPNNINAYLLFTEICLGKGDLLEARENIRSIDRLDELGIVQLDVLQYKRLTDLRIRCKIPPM